ncbi:MAG: hypothetical protein D3924_01760 [Candidatus Electrothrix sp. AR4]|nr:hypothetical protein [Candidatus Electrothrix sp. AR4]
MSEAQIRNSLLNGRPRTMFTSSDKAKVKKFGQAYRNAGLDIQIQKEGSKDKEPPKQSGKASLNKKKKGAKKRTNIRSSPR